MNKELVKEAYEESLEELKKKQIDEIKRIVVKTLEKIDKLQKDKDDFKNHERELDEKIKILKLDIEDLKEGRLDRITERQEKDSKAKDTSVVIIIKEKEIHPVLYPYPVPVSPWYEPYRVIWQYKYPTWTITSGNTITSSDSYSLPINNSIAKFATIGTYEVSGNIINLR